MWLSKPSIRIAGFLICLLSPDSSSSCIFRHADAFSRVAYLMRRMCTGVPERLRHPAAGQPRARRQQRRRCLFAVCLLQGISCCSGDASLPISAASSCAFPHTVRICLLCLFCMLMAFLHLPPITFLTSLLILIRRICAAMSFVLISTSLALALLACYHVLLHFKVDLINALVVIEALFGLLFHG